MKKNITIILLAAGIIFLVWVLLSDGCGKQTDSHQDDSSQVAAERDSVIAREQAGKRREDSLNLSIRQQDTIIKDLMEEKAVSRIHLDRSKNQAYRLSVELKAYERKDTSEFGMKVDSLIAEVSNLTYLLNEYQHYSDSLTKMVDLQKTTYESLKVQQIFLHTQLRGSYDLVNSKYTVLFNDYEDRGKSLKREKLKSKIAALLALVATGLLIVK